MTDAKAWRRSVMSDEEARNFREQYDDCWSTGTVLDEFVRRLGEMSTGHSWEDDGPQFADDHHNNRNPRTTRKCSGDPVCRPAVLFVQREAEKPKPKLMSVTCLDCDQIVRKVPEGDFTMGKEVLRLHKIICPKLQPEKVMPAKCPTCGSDELDMYRLPCGTRTRTSDSWHGEPEKPRALSDAEKIERAIHIADVTYPSTSGLLDGLAKIRSVLRGESK